MKSILRSWGLALLILILVVEVDLNTSWELKFTAFYLGPVLWIAWTRRMREGISMALLAALAWYMVEVWSSGPASSEWFRIWNGLNRVISYTVAAWAVGAFRRTLLVQHATIARMNATMDEVRELKGLLPVCAWCRKIRGDDGQWQSMEAFLSTHTRASASHGICSDCAAKMRADPE